MENPNANRIAKKANRRRGNRNNRAPDARGTSSTPRLPAAAQTRDARPNEPLPTTMPSAPVKTSASPPTSTTRFEDLAKYHVHPYLIDTLTQDLKFEYMTPVQAATFPLILTGNDVLAQAKTGTGKTIAFLLPAIQNLVTQPNRVPGEMVSLLVISPTRELTMQIAEEAKALLKRFPKYSVNIAVGGTNKDTEERRILKGCDILVATPGRLIDHLTTEGEAVRSKLQNLDTLVLDEADRLLDMGFVRDLKRIIGLLPDKLATKRQGMLFSATLADHVENVASLALSKDYKFVSTIPQGEMQTHERVPQQLIVVPTFSDMAAGLVGALRQEMKVAGPGAFKAIVFAPTAHLVDFYAEVLQSLGNMPTVHSLHSRMSQAKRNRVTDEFRQAKNGVMVATDVIARGMDFPGVTNVIQTGLPMDKESYIHRLGRTARAGAEGRGTLIITSHETFFPQYTLKDITFNEVPGDLSAQGAVMSAAERLDPEKQTQIYQAWLGYYKTSTKQLRWTEEELVRQANQFALDGLSAAEVPVLRKDTVGKMGLRGVKGLRVGPGLPRGGGGRRPPQKA